MDTLRVAMIGAGAMARRHLDVLQSLKDVEVVAVSSRGIEKLEKLASDCHIGEQYRDNDRMLKAIKPDAVVVAVSASNIYQVALSCIERGVSALIEKPPGLTAVETKRLTDASKHVEGKFMVGLNRRFYGVMQNARKLIEGSGGLVSLLVQYAEDLRAVRALNVHPPEVFDHWLAADAVHCIDLLRFFGGEVKEVNAFSSSWRDNVADSYGALIRFDSGAIGHFVSNLTSPGRWKAILYGFDMRVDLVPLEEGRVNRRGGEVSELLKSEMDVKFKPGFYGQDTYFLDHVRRGAPIERPAADLEDALGTMKLVEAIAHPYAK
jgi:predicted dehydrogenase